ncbi:MAG: DNA polymerase I, partial [Polaribacter sp.]|nr:DNA polymerase I [Polaribacter sp.]
MSDQKRVFLVDAFALIFRGYYAFIKNPRINSKGLDTSAIMGFMNSLLDVIKRERPDHLAVCFDKGGSVDRVEMFEAYKANRDETPEAIKIAVPYIQEILKAMHIPIMVKEGFEADDVIGTLSKQAEKEGYKTFMVTPDKDFAQLVSENIFMYKPRFGGGYDIWGIPEIQEKFGVETPEQVIDFLGMMGDSADNIPGLPGVGEKTAKKFLATYGSMENLLANTHELKGKMKEKVEGAKDLGLLSKKLATIMLDVPVSFHAKDFELNQPDLEKVTELFNELEFRNLLVNFTRTFTLDVDSSKTNTSENSTDKNPKAAKKSTENHTDGQFDLFATPGTGILSGAEVASGFKTIKNTKHFYQHIDSPLSRKLFLKKLMQQHSVCFDT